MKSYRDALRAPRKVRLDRIDPDDTLGLNQAKSEALLAKNKDALGKLGYRLYAEGKRSILIVLQAMDAAGKDGVLRHVMTGLNPQGVRVTSFKAPTPIELHHDFLWRIHAAVPVHGEIGVFNRSHYEDVLIVRVKNLVPKDVWKQRYDQIREFEELLAESGTTIVKFFLHIDKEEQRERLQARIDNPEKNWKFEPGDLRERELWDDYQRAYEAAIEKCDAGHAPWYVIPANKKWFRNAAVSQILVETLKAMDLKTPDPIADLKSVTVV
jgi:PPK2 family polyphosphate:nucleotide phosphotransferase